MSGLIASRSEVCLEDGAMLRDDFRMAMRRMASAVSVITATRNDEWFGITATSVASLSMDPPSLLVCINRATSIRPIVETSTAFSVNILGPDHAPVSAAFGGAARGADRFEVGSWSANAMGVPILGDAVASIDCIVDGEIEYGTHSIVVGLVTQTRLSTATTPLIYVNGQYQ